MSSKSHEEIYAQFSEAVNMQPRELEDWLETDESNSVGDADRGESTGHRSGRRIVEMKRTSKSDLSDADYQHMNKVVGYIKRHLAHDLLPPDRSTLGATLVWAKEGIRWRGSGIRRSRSSVC